MTGFIYEQIRCIELENNSHDIIEKVKFDIIAGKMELHIRRKRGTVKTIGSCEGKKHRAHSKGERDMAL